MLQPLAGTRGGGDGGLGDLRDLFHLLRDAAVDRAAERGDAGAFERHECG